MFAVLASLHTQAAAASHHGSHAEVSLEPHGVGGGQGGEANHQNEAWASGCPMKNVF